MGEPGAGGNINVADRKLNRQEGSGQEVEQTGAEVVRKRVDRKWSGKVQKLTE